MKKDLSKALPYRVKTMVTYQGTRLFTKFDIKDQTKLQHKKQYCPNINCKNDYLGEIARSSIERIIDHNKCDKISHLLKQ